MSEFYDRMAGLYHLIFRDWDESIERQAGQLTDVIAVAGMLGVFAEFKREVLRERVRAGIARARREGRPHGRPRTAVLNPAEVFRLKAERVSHAEIETPSITRR
jgi:DNA invertase Pin-like site-specific DNA recombinase